MKPKVCELASAIKIRDNIDSVYEKKKTVFMGCPCEETRADLVHYMDLLNISDQKVLTERYNKFNANSSTGKPYS